MANFLAIVLFVFISIISSVNSHGRFMKPASRSSLWRFQEFRSSAIINYDDNAIYCGAVRQLDDPGSRCGVCGDKISDPKPRDNEHGGKYGLGIITGKYSAGQVIDVEVELTAAHMGYMQWRLCTNRNNESQECFNKHILQLANGSGSKLPVENTGMYKTKLRLPVGIKCTECVIQWNYRGGNSKGKCKNGSIELGCGPQVSFRGCSDVIIR